ncbi:MAG: alpha/beta hydrolase [Thermodesulfobacteriota bacterium]
MRQPDSETTNETKAKDGCCLMYRQYPAAGDERARVLIAHGLGEHSGRYGHLIDWLVCKGIGVWAYDHRGHGQSGGKRGHIENFSDYTEDLNLMIGTARADLSDNLPFFLLGHSMGGLMVLHYCQRYPKQVDGVIASSPGLATAEKIPAVKGKIGQILSRVMPAVTMDNELEPQYLSHDADVVDAYVNDPLVHRRISARWFTEFLKAMAETRGAADGIRIPVLLQVAGDDRIVDADTTRRFFGTLTVTDKTLCFYDGLYHEIYNETDTQRQQVLTDLENWLNAHI